MDALNESIENLYAAFAHVPKPKRIDGCGCCINKAEIGRLLSTDLRSLPPDEISPYASSALLTVGSVDDFLYFLPRILEIQLADESFWPAVEVTGRAIKSANPAAWPSELLAALESFVFEAVRSFMAPENLHRIDDWMCAIGRAGLNVAPSLNEIAGSPAAILRFFEENAGDIQDGKLSNEFWEPSDKGYDEIVDWFRSPAVRSVILESYGIYLSRD